MPSPSPSLVRMGEEILSVLILGLPGNMLLPHQQLGGFLPGKLRGANCTLWTNSQGVGRVPNVHREANLTSGKELIYFGKRNQRG